MLVLGLAPLPLLMAFPLVLVVWRWFGDERINALLSSQAQASPSRPVIWSNGIWYDHNEPDGLSHRDAATGCHKVIALLQAKCSGSSSAGRTV